jgi:hypothetical protein
MSVYNPPADRLSLTLPDWRTALKKVLRKVKPPKHPFFYLWIVLAGLQLSFVVTQILSGNYLQASFSLIQAGLAFKMSTLYKNLPNAMVYPPVGHVIRIVGLIWIVAIASIAA